MEALHVLKTLPSPSEPLWRYFDSAKILAPQQLDIRPNMNTLVKTENIDVDESPIAAQLGRLRARCVFIDGVFAETLSFTAQDSGITLTTTQTQTTLLLTGEQMRTQPIDLVQLNTSAATTVRTPFINIVLAANAQAVVLQRFLGQAETRGTQLATTQVQLKENSQLTHSIVQDLSCKETQYHLLKAELGSHGRYFLHHLHMGGHQNRFELQCRLNGQQAECFFKGLHITNGTQLHDSVVVFEHLAAHTRSQQQAFMVVDQNGKSSFTGKICVAPTGPFSKAQQTAKSLLLSALARASIQPLLQILHDEVECTHAATVGHLAEEALFYLRSRGIDLPTAQQLLIYAFAANFLSPQDHPAWLQAYLQATLSRALHIDKGEVWA